MKARIDGFTVAIIATVVAALIVAEIVSFGWFDRTSKVQRREVAQRKALLTVRDLPTSDLPHIAVVGGSLMLDGFDVPLFSERFGSKVATAPYFVLATQYYDWYFGLRRLFAEGIRPRYVLLGLSPNQLASPDIRGDYSARYLFQASDLVSVARRTGMDATAASGFVLSHYSEFYGTRDVIRRFLLQKLLPSVSELLHNRLESGRAPALTTDVLDRSAIERLRDLDELCRENGARFVFVVPPTYQKGAEELVRIGSEQHIAVLAPVPSNTLPDSDYSDGFHLNEHGARIFTNRLAEDLPKALPELGLPAGGSSTASTYR